ARMVADEQHRPVVRDVAEASDLAPEPQAREQPQEGELLADVVGIALVEVGPRDAPLRDASELAPDAAQPRGRRQGVGVNGGPGLVTIPAGGSGRVRLA